MNIIRNILRTIRLIIVTIACGADVGAAYATPYVLGYLLGLAVLAALFIALPLVLVVVGVFGGLPWWTASAGIIWGVALLVLGIWGAPLGAVIAALLELAKALPTPPTLKTGFFLRRWVRWWVARFPSILFQVTKEGVMRYMRFVRGVILAELVVTCALSVFPIRTLPSMIPLLILFIAVVIVSMIHWDIDYGVWKTLINGGAVVGAVTLLIACCVPDISRAVAGRWKTAQKDIAQSITTAGLDQPLPTNAPTALFLPPGRDLVIPPDATFVKIQISPDAYTGWIHLPETWEWVDAWTTSEGFWVQYVGENVDNERPTWVPRNQVRPLVRSPFRVAGEGGYFFLKRKT